MVLLSEARTKTYSKRTRNLWTAFVSVLCTSVIWLVGDRIFYQPTLVSAPQCVDRAASKIVRKGPLPLPTSSKYAFATFLGRDTNADNVEHPKPDNYLTAARILTYQLVHAPETRSQYPLIVMTTPDVAEWKRQRLAQEGAIVWDVDNINPGLVKSNVSTWEEQMTKLRLWQLEQFERVAFIDADSTLTRCVDGLFNDSATHIQHHETSAGGLDEYVFAANKETNQDHQWPPVRDGVDYPNPNYFNGGFFILKPSRQMFEHYLAFTNTTGLFDSTLMEQALLNYVHRRGGPMPWAQVDIKWAVHYPTIQDIRGGVHVAHGKWWNPDHESVAPYLLSWRWRMEGFFESQPKCPKESVKLE